MAVVLLDAGMKQVEVFVRSLTRTSDTRPAVGDVDGYVLYDLVETLGDAGTPEAGVIVALGHREITLLMANGKTKTVTVTQLRGRIRVRPDQATALDVLGNALAVADSVKVSASGAAAAAAWGPIKHIWSGRVFLHDFSRPANAGMFVARARDVMLEGTKVRPSITTPAANIGAGGRGGGRGGFAGGMGRGAGGGGGSDLRGKTVQILSGNFKGKKGIVKDAGATNVTVELHGTQKKINLPPRDVREIGDAGGALPGSGVVLAGAPAAGAGARAGAAAWHATVIGGAMTPAVSAMGAMTPAVGGAFGAATPFVGGGGAATPYVGAGGAATPYAGGGGAATPYAGGGGAATPYVGGGGGGGAATPYAPGLQTPAAAYAPAGQTPAVGARTPAVPYGGFGSGGGVGSSGDHMHSDGEVSWFAVGVYVNVTAGPNAGQTGIIRMVQGGGVSCLVALGGAAAAGVSIPVADLRPQLPSNNDYCRCIRGPNAGQVGIVVSVDAEGGGVYVCRYGDDAESVDIQSANSLVRCAPPPGRA